MSEAESPVSPRSSSDLPGAVVLTHWNRRQWYMLDGLDMSWSCRVVFNEHLQPLVSMWATRGDDVGGGVCWKHPLGGPEGADTRHTHDVLAQVARWVPAAFLSSVRAGPRNARVAVVWAWGDLHAAEAAPESHIVTEVGVPYTFVVWTRYGTEARVQSWHDDFAEAFLADDLWVDPATAVPTGK